MRSPKIRIFLIRCLFILPVVLTVALAAIFIATAIIDEHIKIRPDWAAVSFCQTMDNEPPQIILDNDLVLSKKIGDDFPETNATAVDDCDEVEIIKSGSVDRNTIGTYNVSYRATDNAGNSSEIVQTINILPEYRGVIYLTFDDGPGDYTAELLDILAKYNVKATFFVTGYGNDELILREYNEGHTVALHTASHDYSNVYSSIDAFFGDLSRVQARVKNITGQTTFLMRFPGGSSNTVSRRYDGGIHIMTRLASEVEARGFTYFDWNISSGDAGQTTSSDAVFENVVYALKEGGDSVVLQHDVKSYSVAAVERIIQFGLSNGYVFKKLETSSPTAHHRINN